MRSLVSPDFFVTHLILEFVEGTQLGQTGEGERVIQSVLTVYQNHTFKATMKLMDYCIQKETDSNCMFFGV